MYYKICEAINCSNYYLSKGEPRCANENKGGCNVHFCSTCQFTDGVTYTSNLPKVKCTITGKYHLINDVCDVDTNKMNCEHKMPCGLCYLTKNKCNYYDNANN